MSGFRLATEQEMHDWAHPCGSQPSARSTARCETPARISHDDCAGRTPGGYWKFWNRPKGSSMSEQQQYIGTDPQAWASAFMVATNTQEGLGEDQVTRWFAAAINTGRLTGQDPVTHLDIEKAAEIVHQASESDYPWSALPERRKVAVRAAVKALRAYLMDDLDERAYAKEQQS